MTVADFTTERPDDAADPQVSILVVAFNSLPTIARCLDAIAAGAVANAVEVLLVDNGSDGTGAFVAANYPQVRIVPSIGNVGFARGNNLLARHARAPYLLLLNPDFFVAPGAVDALVEGARRYPAAAAWGGISVDASGTPDTGNAIVIPGFTQLLRAALGLSLAAPPGRDLDGDEQVEVISGGFAMLSHVAWDRAGGFDERFFLYCEEVDLFQRLRRMGYPVMRLGSARGEHLIAHGQTLTPRRLLLRTAGIMEYVRKHWGLPWWVVGAVLIWLAAVERYLAGRLFGKSRPRLARLGSAHQIIARRPGLWWHGYHPTKGLLAQGIPDL